MNKAHYPFIKFLVAGGVAALANVLSRIFFGNFVSYISSIVAAYLVGMIVAYSICRLWVFEPKTNSTFKQVSYFTIVNIFAVVQTIVVSLIFSDYIFIDFQDPMFRETAAHFLGVCFPVFSSYIGHKYLTFK